MLYINREKSNREVDLIVDKMLEEGINYRLVPKSGMGPYGEYGERHIAFREAEYTHGSKVHKIAIIEKDEIIVGEHVPEKFRSVIAAHEYGHRKGLTHQEIFILELAVADKLEEMTGDYSLKEDYLKWSSSDEMFQMVRGNFGREKELELWDYPETKYKDIMEKFGAEDVFEEDGDNFVQIF